MAELYGSVLRQEEGASAVEYGLLAGLIALVIAAGAVILGGGLNSILGDVGTEMENAAEPNRLPAPDPEY